ncbi:MAG: archaemetzincin family Zn-dependent metalloprotease [Candidatus Bathycorpusculaceae bacterium]
MKIGILRIGKINSHIIERVQENLRMIFPKTTCTIIAEKLPVPEETFDKTRNQYFSGAILSIVKRYAEKAEAFDRVLGIIDVDIFVPHLNFVFGEAECPGKAALISLWRLRPEFYDEAPDMGLFLERSTKEAVHELGHTLGLRHCSNPFCVMFFSNSIFETDRKQSLFCNKCYLKVEAVINNLG